MKSCSIEVNGKKYTEEEVYDMHRRGESFNDAVIPTQPSGTIIAGVPLRMQLEVADSIANEVLFAIEGFGKVNAKNKVEKEEKVDSEQVKKILDSKKKSIVLKIQKKAKFLQEKIERHRQNLEEDLTEEQQAEEQRQINIAFRNLVAIQSTIHEYSKLENMALKMLAARNVLSFNTSSVDQFVEFLEENDFRNFDEDFSFERDLKDSLSLAMKAFLSQIEKKKPNGESQLSWFGDKTYHDMNDLYIELQHILSGKFPNAETYKQELKKYADAKPWVNEVLERLNAYEKQGDQSVTNGFVRAFTSHPINMLYIQYTAKNVTSKRNIVDSVTGKPREIDVVETIYEAEIVESNRNTLTNVLLENWQSEHFFSDIYFPQGNDKYIRPGTAAEFQEILESKEDKKTVFKKAMAYIGIEISDSLLNAMEKEGIMIGNKRVSLNDLILDKNRYLSKIKDQLTNWENNKVAFSKENLFDANQMRSLFRSLAKADSKYNDMAFASSFRSGDKSLSAFGLNRYAVTKLRDLMTNRNGVREVLKKFKFNNNLWLNLMDDPNLANFFDIPFYADVAMFRKRKGSPNKNKELKDMSKDEHFQAMLDLFFNNGLTEWNAARTKEYRIIKTLYLTMSDKKNKYILSHPTEIVNNFDLLDEEGKLNSSVIDHLFATIFMPEYSRILAEQENRKNGIVPNIKEYSEGYNKFYFMPFLHKVDGLFKENGEIVNVLNTENNDSAEIITAIKKAIFENVNEEFKTFRENAPKETRISVKYTDLVKKNLGNQLTTEQVLNTAMADFFVTNMVTNMRVTQNISGDPALAYKPSKSNKTGTDKVLDDIRSSWDNYGKRLAKDNASGYETESSSDEKLRVLALDDAKISSEFKDMLKHAGYGDMDSTDAQAYMTVKSFAYHLHKEGSITTKEYQTIIDAYEKDEIITDENLLSKLARPLKPVIVADVRDSKSGVERKVYIKFSAYPLLPQLTKGTEMDKLRIMMKEQNHDIAAFSSAIKLGNVRKPLKVFDDKRSFVPAEAGFNFEDVTIEIPAESWKIQQAVPDKDIDLINRGTQFAKLLFANLRSIVNDTINVPSLEKEYDDLYRQLFKMKAQQLQNELYKKIDGKLVLNFEKFKEIISQELLDRKYDSNSLEYFRIELSEFADGVKANYEYPFWAIPINKRIQPVIQSIIDNRIRKTKFPGQSYVLASSTGYKTEATTLEDYKASGGKVMWVKGHELGNNLKPQRFDGKTTHAAEVILPWRLVDNDGNRLDPKDFMDAEGYLNLPEELLTLNGFRIPTQGINSMSHIKVVGFLPVGVQNIIIAPAEYVTQMGSDFDVDKLYTYSKFYRLNDKGQIEIINEANATKDDNEKVIINKIIDIQTKVLSAPDPTIQGMLAKPLDYGMFDDGLADEINEKTSKSRSNMFISPLYQLDNYVKASTAKDAVGAFSLSSTFNSMIQTSKTPFVLPIGERMFREGSPMSMFRYDDLYLTSGSRVLSNVLNNTATIRGKRTKADVISAIQSAAVDNENKRFLEKVNLNRYTMPVISAMTHLGFEEDHIFYLINQPAILKDSSVLKKEPEQLTAIFYEFLNKKVSELQQQAPNENPANLENRVILAVKSAMKADISQWQKALETEDPYFQMAAIIKGNIYYGLGNKIKEYQTLLNIDSSGLKESFFKTWVFEKKFRSLFESKDPIVPLIVEQVDKPTPDSHTLYGKHYIPKKLSSVLYFEELKLFSESIVSDERFSIYETSVMNAVLEEIVRNKLKKTDYAKYKNISISDWLSIEDDVRNIEADLIKFLMSNSNLFNGNMIEMSKKLLNNTTGLANRIIDIKKTTIGKQNKFLKSLDVIQRKNPDTDENEFEIIFRASRKINDSDESFATALESLYQNVNEIEELGFSPQQLIIDLVRYNFIKDPFQSATNFGRFISPTILKDLEIHTQLKKFDLSDPFKTVGYSNDPFIISTFVRQFLQNNPESAYIVELGENEMAKTDEVLSIIETKNETIYPSSKGIVYYGNNLYQSNGDSFVRIPTLDNEYDSSKSFINKSIRSPFTFTFSYYHGEVNSPVTSAFLGESVPMQRLNNAIKNSDIYEAFKAIEEDENAPVMYRGLSAAMMESEAFQDVLLKFDSNVSFARATTMKEFNVAAFNPEQWKKLPLILKQKYFLHEAVHTATMKVIEQYSSAKTKANLTKEQIEALDRLTVFKKIVESKIKSQLGRTAVKDFEAKYSEFIKGNNKVRFSKLEEILYATRNLDEFVAAVMTDESTQKALDSVMLTENKSLFDKFKEVLLKLLTSLGIDVSEGNIYLSDIAVRDVVTLISSQDNFLISDENYKVFELSEDNPIFSNC